MRRLNGELETFTDWCNGSVLEYVVEDAEGAIIDSCGGMYGLDYAEKTAQEVLNDEVARIVDDSKKETLRLEGKI